MNPREYCTDKAAPPGSSLYYAALFHPLPERRALHACFAFLEEIRRDLASVTDPAPTARRLLWWREELGTPRMAASTHPLMVELRALPMTPAEVTAQLESGVVSALEELAGWQPESDAQWRSHCQSLHAGVWQLAARACATTDHAGVVDGIGAFAALSGQLQQVLELAPRTAAGRCPLPRPLLQAHGLDIAAGAGLLTNPRFPAAIKTTLADLHVQLRQCAGTGKDSFNALPLFCRVLHLVNVAHCRRLLQQPERLLTERVALTPLRKLWIAWRQSR